MGKIVKFFKESYRELRKVVWPGFSDVKISTRVVVVSVFFAALFLGLIDFLFWGVVSSIL